MRKLRLQRVHDERRVVAQQARAEGQREVDVAVAVEVVDIRPLRALRDERIEHVLDGLPEPERAAVVGEHLPIALGVALGRRGLGLVGRHQTIHMRLLLRSQLRSAWRGGWRRLHRLPRRRRLRWCSGCGDRRLHRLRNNHSARSRGGFTDGDALLEQAELRRNQILERLQLAIEQRSHVGCGRSGQDGRNCRWAHGSDARGMGRRL